MAAKYELEELIEIVTPLIRHYDEIDRAFIFGSYARGEADAKSDLDIRIDADKLRNMDLCALMVRVERALNMTVHIIPTDSVPENYLSSIKENEVSIYERCSHQY